MASRKISTPKPRAFTLIELLVVLGLLTIVGGLGLIMSMDDFRGYSFRSERDTIVSALEKARSQSISNICLGAVADCADGKPHGVHFTSGQYTIFQGYSYHDTPQDAAVDEVITGSDAAVVVSGMTDIVFSELAATTTATGGNTLTISDTGGSDSSTITVSPEGRICWDDPGC